MNFVKQPVVVCNRQAEIDCAAELPGSASRRMERYQVRARPSNKSFTDWNNPSSVTFRETRNSTTLIRKASTKGESPHPKI
jgi:hypothetical protein